MTPSGRGEAVLVCGPRPPLDGDRVVVSPSSGVSFDGDRWDVPVIVRVVDEDRTASETSSGLPVACRRAVGAIEAGTPDLVVLESPSLLRETVPEGSGRRFVSRLRTTATGRGATFLAWQPEPPTERVRRRFDLVVDRVTDASGPAGSPDRRRRRGSRTADTGSRAASRDR